MNELKLKLMTATIKHLYKQQGHKVKQAYCNEQAKLWMDGIRDGRIGDSTIQSHNLLRNMEWKY